jgi:NADH-quinone oxidoreductase subunit J
MNIQEFVFGCVVGVTLLGAFLAVWLKNVFYNALSLILCLFGVAALFIFLNAEFLAVVEVIVYIGAISIAIIFAIMLTHPQFRQNEPRVTIKVFRAFVIAGLLFLGLRKTLLLTEWPVVSTEGDYGVAAIGRTLLTRAALPFEAVSVVLLVAIIGALLISNKEARR